MASRRDKIKATGESKDQESLHGALTPVWFDLPQSFWQDLAEISKETGIKPAKLISRGIKLCLKEFRGQLRPSLKLREGEWINAAYLRGTTKEQRSESARRAAMARWHPNPNTGKSKSTKQDDGTSA